MKKSWLALSLLTASFSSFAGANLISSTGEFVIPDVTLDGKHFFDSVTLKLNFATGKFEVISYQEKNKAISNTPLQTYTFNSIKTDFLGCTKTGVTQVSCYINLTNSDNDVQISIYGNNDYTLVYDNFGEPYKGYINLFGQSSAAASSNYIETTLLKGVPVRVEYVFNNLNNRATSIAAFKPAFLYSKAYYMADFRNISF